MSSILLSSPYAAPPPSATSPQPEPAQAAAIAPLQASKAGGTASDASSFSGSGTGTGNSNQGDNVALLRKKAATTFPRPAEATGGSVVNAQAQKEAEAVPYGANLPDVEMPYPLPTSPFLKRD